MNISTICEFIFAEVGFWVEKFQDENTRVFDVSILFSLLIVLELFAY